MSLVAVLLSTTVPGRALAQLPTPDPATAISRRCLFATMEQMPGGMCDWTGMVPWFQRDAPSGQIDACNAACHACCDAHGGMTDLEAALASDTCQCVLALGTGGAASLNCVGPTLVDLLDQVGVLDPEVADWARTGLTAAGFLRRIMLEWRTWLRWARGGGDITLPGGYNIDVDQALARAALFRWLQNRVSFLLTALDACNEFAEWSDAQYRDNCHEECDEGFRRFAEVDPPPPPTEQPPGGPPGHPPRRRRGPGPGPGPGPGTPPPDRPLPESCPQRGRPCTTPFGPGRINQDCRCEAVNTGNDCFGPRADSCDLSCAACREESRLGERRSDWCKLHCPHG
jgi:hypothetical protein